MHEQFANEFFNLTNDLLCVIDSQGRFVDVNPSFTRILGWTREELLASSYLDFIHPEDHAALFAALAKTNENTPGPPLENRYRCKDGSFRWLHWETAIKKSDDRIWAIGRDITQVRNETHDQIALIGALNEGFIIRDAKGKLLRHNTVALKILEISEEELDGRGLNSSRWRVVDEKGNAFPAQEQPSAKALATGQPQLKKTMGVILDNHEIRWIQVSAAPLFSNHDHTQPDRVLAVFQDITEQVAIQKRLEIAVTAGKFGIWEWNIRNNNVFWDASMYQIYGVSQSDFGYNREAVAALIFQDDRKDLREKIQHTLENRGDFSGEFRIRRPDGAIRILKAESKGFYDEHGIPIRHVGVNWDITEQREQEFKLIHASKMSSLGEVSAGIAHEINNPLAIILGKNYQLQNMIDRGNFDEAALQKSVTAIDQTTKRIAKIIKGLRSFARDDAMDPFERCEVHTLVDDVLSFCKARFTNRSVTLDIQNAIPEMIIECRVPQIMQVLMNLLNNAFDAVESLPEKWVRLEMHDDRDWIIFKVVDSGEGIPKGIREKILQPFFTTKSIGKGTGLGLSISSGLVKSHGGTLEIDESSVHTCFVVRLPKTQKGRK